MRKKGQCWKQEGVQVVCIRLMAEEGEGRSPIRSVARRARNVGNTGRAYPHSVEALTWENGGISTARHHSGGKQVQGQDRRGKSKLRAEQVQEGGQVNAFLHHCPRCPACMNENNQSWLLNTNCTNSTNKCFGGEAQQFGLLRELFNWVKLTRYGAW